MTATDCAIAELERAGLMSKDSDYDGMIGEAVKELLLVFQKQGHSGHSAPYVATLFKKLVAGDVLSPLTDDASEWVEVGPEVFQSNRCSHVFREKDGKAYTIQGKVFSDDGGKSYFQNRDSRVYFDLPGYPPETERVTLTQTHQELSQMKPIVGYMILECEERDEIGDLVYFDGQITGPQNPKGANLAWSDPIPMIEKSAYDKLRKALEFYADKRNWIIKRRTTGSGGVVEKLGERGKIARAALGLIKTHQDAVDPETGTITIKTPESGVKE